MPEEFPLTSAQATAFAEAHMAAEVELAIENPEFRQSLVEDAAAADEEMAPYYADLFERIKKPRWRGSTGRSRLSVRLAGSTMSAMLRLPADHARPLVAGDRSRQTRLQSP